MLFQIQQMLVFWSLFPLPFLKPAWTYGISQFTYYWSLLLLLLLLLLRCFSHAQLCETWDGSPPGFPVPGIVQARTLEWVVISFSNAWKWKVKVKSISRVRLLVTPWTTAYQAPPSRGFSRQEYWSRVPRPSPNIFSTPWQMIILVSRYRLSPLHF